MVGQTGSLPGFPERPHQRSLGKLPVCPTLAPCFSFLHGVATRMEREIGPFSPDLLLRFRLLDLMIALIIAETVVGLPPQFAQNQRAARRYQRPPRAEPGRAL